MSIRSTLHLIVVETVTSHSRIVHITDGLSGCPDARQACAHSHVACVEVVAATLRVHATSGDRAAPVTPDRLGILGSDDDNVKNERRKQATDHCRCDSGNIHLIKSADVDDGIPKVEACACTTKNESI
jgi:hypothetical protein